MTDFDPVNILDAARATIPFLPVSTTLEATMFEPGDPLPPPDALAVRASLVGAAPIDLMLVASDLIQEALAGAEGMTVGDALRPALEAAATQLGTGVLDTAVETQVGGAFGEDGWNVVTLSSDGRVEGWFAVRDRSAENADFAGADAAFTGAQPEAEATGSSVTPATPQQRAESMRLLYDVEMTLTAEIGRAKLPLHDILDLTPGSVIELDRSAGAPADVMVNGRLIARGEIVVVDEEYGIRITEIVSLADQKQ